MKSTNRKANLAHEVDMNKTVNEYMNLPYARVLTPDSDGFYMAEILEFEGCLTEGETPAKALKNLETVAKDWLETRLEEGLFIPEPFAHSEMSGRFALRMPQSLHTKAAVISERDGISLNTFIVNAIASAVGIEDAFQKVMRSLEEFRENLRPVYVFNYVAGTNTQIDRLRFPDAPYLFAASASSGSAVPQLNK